VPIFSAREIGKGEQPEVIVTAGSRGKDNLILPLRIFFLFFHGPPLPSVSRSRILERHGLFTVERGRAGSDVEGLGEEAGSVPPADSRHAWFSDGQTQMQDFLKMYSNLVERCFNACCNDFTSKALSSKEVRSITLRHSVA